MALPETITSDQLVTALKQMGLGRKARAFNFLNDQALAVADAIMEELRKRGGYDDLWHDMLPEMQEALLNDLAKIIRKKVNLLVRN